MENNNQIKEQNNIIKKQKIEPISKALFLNSSSNKELFILVLLLIDIEKIKKEAKLQIKQNNEKYCILSIEWFKKYIELNNMNEIYEYLVNNNNILYSILLMMIIIP